MQWYRVAILFHSGDEIFGGLVRPHRHAWSLQTQQLGRRRSGFHPENRLRCAERCCLRAGHPYEARREKRG
jgi:hypothetical protein